MENIFSRISNIFHSKSPNNEPNHFLVTSQGNAGSIWLASSLNLHPDICCSMGTEHPIVSMNDIHSITTLPESNLATLKKTWTERIQGPEDLKYGIKDIEKEAREFAAEILLKKGVEFTIPNRVPPIHPDIIFSELEHFYNAAVYGNIHGITIHNLTAFTQKGLIERRPIIANLIRHPVSRFHALVARSVDLTPPDAVLDPEKEQLIESHPELIESLNKKHDIDWQDARNRFWFWAFVGLDSLSWWAKEISEFPHVLHIPMEKAMTDRDYLSAVITVLTQGRLKAGADYLDGVFSFERQGLGRVHPHQLNQKTKSPEQLFHEWPEWVQTLFKEQTQALNLEKLHAPYDYDFSFLDS